MHASHPPIPNPYQRRFQIRLFVGGVCMAFFVLSQIKALDLGIPILWSAISFGVGGYFLLFAWNSGEDRRVINALNRPGEIIAYWTYTDGEWEDFWVARNLMNEDQRKAMPKSDVWIGRNEGFIHGTLREWNNNWARLTKVEIVEGPLDVLLFSYTTRRMKGHETDARELAIPIPRAKRGEAEIMVHEFQKTRRLAAPVKS